MTPSALADIGVLLAAPLDRAEFEERVRSSDWLGKFRLPDASPEELRASLDKRWIDTYSPLVAEPLLDLARFARSGGAEVRTRAALPDLAAFTRVKQLVILFAHWKGPEIVLDDLIPGWSFAAFRDRAGESPAPLGNWVAAALRKRSSKPGSDALLDVLNEALDAHLPDPPGSAGSILEHAVTRQARRREELEDLFLDLLRPGNRLEMFDGLHSKEEVDAVIAPDFSGVLDLTTCTSTVLADYLSARRKHRLRTVQFPMAVEFIWAAEAVTRAVQLTSTGNFGYQEARDLATRMLNEAIEDLARGVG